MRLCTGRVAIVHMNADAPIFVQKRESAHFYRRMSSRRRRRLSRRLLQKALRRRDFFREGMAESVVETPCAEADTDRARAAGHQLHHVRAGHAVAGRSRAADDRRKRGHHRKSAGT